MIVATDDERIADAVAGLRRHVRMTRGDAPHRHRSPRRESPTTSSCEIVVNVQGDEPLIEPGMIAEVLAAAHRRSGGADDHAAAGASTDAADIANPHVVKVVVTTSGDALYFSRAPIPLRRDAGPAEPAAFTSTSVSTLSARLPACVRALSLRRRSNRPRRSNSCARSSTAIGFVPLRRGTTRSAWTPRGS